MKFHGKGIIALLAFILIFVLNTQSTNAFKTRLRNVVANENQVENKRTKHIKDRKNNTLNNSSVIHPKQLNKESKNTVNPVIFMETNYSSLLQNVLSVFNTSNNTNQILSDFNQSIPNKSMVVPSYLSQLNLSNFTLTNLTINNIENLTKNYIVNIDETNIAIFKLDKPFSFNFNANFLISKFFDLFEEAGNFTISLNIEYMTIKTLFEQSYENRFDGSYTNKMGLNIIYKTQAFIQRNNIIVKNLENTVAGERIEKLFNCCLSDIIETEVNSYIQNKLNDLNRINDQSDINIVLDSGNRHLLINNNLDVKLKPTIVNLSKQKGLKIGYNIENIQKYKNSTYNFDKTNNDLAGKLLITNELMNRIAKESINNNFTLTTEFKNNSDFDKNLRLNLEILNITDIHIKIKKFESKMDVNIIITTINNNTEIIKAKISNITINSNIITSHDNKIRIDIEKIDFKKEQIKVQNELNLIKTAKTYLNTNRKMHIDTEGIYEFLTENLKSIQPIVLFSIQLI